VHRASRALDVVHVNRASRALDVVHVKGQKSLVVHRARTPPIATLIVK